MGRLILTHIRASRFVDPDALTEEVASVFGRGVAVANDLDVSGF